jgi:hypothetical protein
MPSRYYTLISQFSATVMKYLMVVFYEEVYIALSSDVADTAWTAS